VTASTGITINWYAADRSGNSAKLGVPVPNAEAYVGIPAQSMTPPPDVTAASLKVSVTASTVSGSPTVALIDHATKRPYGVKQMSEGPVFVFDGVEKGKQVDIIDGAGYGPALNISHVRVEPSGTAQQDIAPPPDVTNATATVASATSLTLNWVNPTVADFDRVEISSPSFATTVVVAKTDSTYTVTGLTTGTSYSFTIRAVDTTKLASAGVTVTATPASMAPLLDETMTQALTTAVKTSPLSRITVAGSKLAYYTADITWSTGNNAPFFNSWGALNATSPYKWTSTVGATPPTVKNYIAVPAEVTSSVTGSQSVKLTIKATQHQAYANHHLLVLDGTNKVLAIGPAFPNGQGGSTPLLTFVVDGVRPNTEIRLSSDDQYMFLSAVKVETSTTTVTDTPAVVQQ
jgi:hypothetical protein